MSYKYYFDCRDNFVCIRTFMCTDFENKLNKKLFFLNTSRTKVLYSILTKFLCRAVAGLLMMSFNMDCDTRTFLNFSNSTRQTFSPWLIRFPRRYCREFSFTSPKQELNICIIFSINSLTDRVTGCLTDHKIPRTTEGIAMTICVPAKLTLWFDNRLETDLTN